MKDKDYLITDFPNTGKLSKINFYLVSKHTVLHLIWEWSFINEFVLSWNKRALLNHWPMRVNELFIVSDGQNRLSFTIVYFGLDFSSHSVWRSSSSEVYPGMFNYRDTVAVILKCKCNTFFYILKISGKALIFFLLGC